MNEEMKPNWKMSHKSYFSLLVLSLLLQVIFGNICLAETGDTKKQTSAQLQVDPEFNPEQGTYYYDIFWQKVRVGKATITLIKEGDLYKIIVYGKTVSKVFFSKDGNRYGVECKFSEAPKITKSMHIAMADLELSHLYVIYPGKGSYPVAENISVVSLADARNGNNFFQDK